MKPFNNITISAEEPANETNVWIKHCKNMFKTLPTFTNNGDGTITVSGTATAVTYVVLGTFTFDDNSYALSGCPANGGNDKYSIYITNTLDWSQIAQDLGEGDIFNNANGKTGEVRLRIANGYICNNLIFKPQLEISKRVTDFVAAFDDDILIKEFKKYKSLFDNSEHWINLELENGAEAYNSSYTPQIKKINNVIFIRGMIKNVDGQNFNFAKIPDNFIPEQNINFLNRMNSDGSYANFVVGANGHLQLIRNSKLEYNLTDFYAINISYAI